jgi:hypothetical protein
MEARLGSCDTREFIMVPARELARELFDGGEAGGSDGGVKMRGVVEVSGAGSKWGNCGVRGDGELW